MGWGSTWRRMKSFQQEEQSKKIGELAWAFMCEVEVLPSMYLGLPLCVLYKSKTVLDEVEERLQKRLVSWKRQYLSKCKKIIFIKSNFVNLLIFIVSLLVILKSMHNSMDFSESREEKVRNPFLVIWKIACSGQKRGVATLSFVYGVFLGKWCQHFAESKGPHGSHYYGVEDGSY